MTTTIDRRTDWTAIGAGELADVVALRRAIHAEPEIGNHCPRTTEKLKAALVGLPLEIHDSKTTTGFVAILRGGRAGQGSNTRTVLLRGDMDALPMNEETGLDFASTVTGAMHACGHDAHCAMLAGAARALCARKEQLSGTVVFMFQPGEEGQHGARHMIEDGLLNIARPDAAFALHISPNAPAGLFIGREGPLLASTDTVHATIRGKGGHAAMPHDCLDPIPVACEIVGAVQTFIARRVPVSDPAVLTITKIHAGSAHNIIPDEVKLGGTLRTLSEATRGVMRAAFRQIATDIATAHGCTAEVEIDEGYPVTMCDPRATGLMRTLAGEISGEEGWSTMPSPMMGGEDFSYVLREVPGAMAFIGVAPEGSDPRTNPPLHNTKMTIDEATMAKGIAMHCAAAERYLANGFD
ncbi:MULTISPECIES: M20 family metallopeptidase [unclassified Sphingomonas]|uniref:M20 metallopeptidase family protein n=1 Tax=unclassified Sphingomonas TaxID=196159 RepID=UPI00092BD814|nr:MULTISPECIES: M20 family metallopeptidase [unclassified Sphingomonas]MBN8847731.1 amidohydrolase [Sphingomonas sp.]MBS0285572.1 amidohydrolase [Pseudomonadota bacterium]OJV31835.1 MAG: amidohydrolase [Sphingomonas sp. 67-36]